MFRILGLLICLSTSIANGGVVYELNFDSAIPAYSQSGGDGSPSLNLTGTGSIGNGAVLSFTPANASDGAVNFFSNVSLNMGDLLGNPISTQASDYTFSFDAKVEGLESPNTNAYVQAQFKLAGETYQSGFNVTEQFASYQFTLPSGPLDPAAFTSDSPRPEFRFDVFSIGSRFGTDTGNSLSVDNLRISEVTAVPEPSSMALLAIGGAGLVWRRRRANKSAA
ncbi:PEP-CTERM sorting domain-containing protein [Rhodopirellula sp. P2]|uniref:PEP-CTERM sorting domain-containing protein n=1 Tax=Rhodopirellula sp. P2 TaxID=2127060 RepID=UPI00236892C4|nr:PEP-CTERM sorting domain-containing protein [Rhodopirellula sp. P2]WDQ15521.1 PEP-CTERM sorting domain-containing protein [Rhodopirellula sp. P2]